MEHGKRQFALQRKPKGDDHALSEHLKAAEGMRPGITKKLMPSIDQKLRPEAEFLWGWYLDLSASRQIGGMGFPQPLGFAEIWAWCQLHRISLQPWQLRTLRLLDMHHMRAMMEKDVPTKEELDG